MTNQEKLKKILQTINSNGNLAAVVSELLIAVDSSSLDVLAQLPEDNSIIELKNSLNPIFSTNADTIKNFEKTKQDYISALEKTTNSKWIEKAEELFNKNYTSAGAKNLFGEFKKIYESVSTRSMQNASIVALSAFAATCAQHEKDPNIAVLKEFITLASFSFKDVFVGKTLAEHCVETIRIADPSLAEKTAKLFDRILTANKIAYTPNNANHIGCSVKKDKDNQVLSYYENMQKQPLVQNFDKVDETTTIEEAIAKFDLKENSKYIAYALSKLEGKIRENPDLKTDNTGLAVLASEIAFLYMCAAGQKEVDDRVLAAILDPVIEINTTHGGKAIEKAVEAANDVVKGLTGKDYFAEQRPVIIGENENPESTTLSPLQKGLNAGVITSIIKAPLEKILVVKKITLAVNNAKDAIREDHYKLVGSPIVGKKKKLPEGIAQDERDLMLNLNLTSKGKGKAAKILNAAVKTVLADYKTQAKKLRDTRKQLQEQFENNSLSQNEIDDFNKQVSDFNSKIDSLTKEINGMFVEGLKNENLISETYADMAEDLYKD